LIHSQEVAKLKTTTEGKTDYKKWSIDLDFGQDPG
jgi:hypothetical protein